MSDVMLLAETQQVSTYHERGFVVLRNVFDPLDIDILDQEARELYIDDARRVSLRNLRCRYMPHHATGEKLFECFDPIIDISPQAASIARHERLLAVLAAIYGEPAYLFKDKLIFKPAGAVGYPLHQDYIAWPSFPRSFLTVLIPLDPATEGNGCTVVYGGLHRQGLLTPADGKFHPTPRDAVAHAPRIPLVMQPGDVAIFHGFTPHESEPNRSDQSRRQLYLSYNARSDGGEQRDSHYAEFHRFLRARPPNPDGGEWFFD